MAAPDGLGTLTGKGPDRSRSGLLRLNEKPHLSRTVTGVTSAMTYIPYIQNRPEDGKAGPGVRGRDDGARHGSTTTRSQRAAVYRAACFQSAVGALSRSLCRFDRTASFAFDRTRNRKGLAEADAIAATSSPANSVALCYRRQRLAGITALDRFGALVTR